MVLAPERLNKNQIDDKAFKDSGSKQRASRGTQKKELGSQDTSFFMMNEDTGNHETAAGNKDSCSMMIAVMICILQQTHITSPTYACMENPLATKPCDTLQYRPQNVL